MSRTQGKALRMWALDAPQQKLDAGLLVLWGQGEVTVPFPVYVIEHPRGLVLFDTGIVPEALDDPHAVYGDLAHGFVTVGAPELRVDRQLESLGFSTSDVTHVILSHAHWDHSGGISLFPDATFYVGEGELPFGFWPTPGSRLAFRTQDLDFLRSFKVVELPQRDLDLFGDGSLVILFTPGHTPGELSLIVRLENHEFLLAGDVVHLKAGLENEFAMPMDWNAEESVRSIRRLNQISAATGAEIWVPHDEGDWAKYKHAPHYYD
ncbi:N-acyl homoserine lactonase family protein [Alloalcanivorax gelatiniphagus]